MYVCICRAVTMSRIKAAVRAGAATVDAVEEACGAGGDCGSCREEIEGVIFDCREESAADCASCPSRTRDRGTPRAA
jgi:bacterioferritin-associated ferredoxin